MKYNVVVRNKKNDIQKQVNRQQMDGYFVRNCINHVQYKEKSSNTLGQRILPLIKEIKKDDRAEYQSICTRNRKKEGEKNKIYSDNKVRGSRNLYCMYYFNNQINEKHKKRRSLKRNKKRSSGPENINLCTCDNGRFGKNIYFSLDVDER